MPSVRGMGQWEIPRGKKASTTPQDRGGGRWGNGEGTDPEHSGTIARGGQSPCVGVPKNYRLGVGKETGGRKGHRLLKRGKTKAEVKS